MCTIKSHAVLATGCCLHSGAVQAAATGLTGQQTSPFGIGSVNCVFPRRTTFKSLLPSLKARHKPNRSDYENEHLSAMLFHNKSQRFRQGRVLRLTHGTTEPRPCATQRRPKYKLNTFKPHKAPGSLPALPHTQHMSVESTSEFIFQQGNQPLHFTGTGSSPCSFSLV